MILTVDQLIDQVRSQSDEFNEDNLTDSHILDLLNRGQRKAANIIARKFDSLFLESTTVSTTAGTREYDIPDAAFGRRIEKVEVRQGDISWNLKRINFHKRDQFISSTQTARPYYYLVKKNKIEIFPKPNGGLTLDVFYQKRAEDLVKSQGRITSITTGSGTETMLIDVVGSDLSTSVSTVQSGGYINIVDYVTGAVKRSLQISAIDTSLKQLTVKTASLTRSTVLDKTISTTIGSDATVDDYVCLVTGTAVPELDGAYVDYLIAFAVHEARRRFGENVEADYRLLKDLEKELEKMWSGRESSHRVRKSGGHWGNSLGSSTRRLLT